jgi:hypothetical protein
MTPDRSTRNFAMVKLRHRAFAAQEGPQQRHHGVGTDSVMLREIVYFLQALVG